MVVATIIGILHYKGIPAMFYQMDLVNFKSAGGYLSSALLKPLVLIACAMVVTIYLHRGGETTLVLWAMLTGLSLFGLSIIGKLIFSGVSLQALGGDNPVMRSFLGFTGLHANAIGLMFNVGIAVQLFSLPGVKSRPLRFFLLASIAVSFVVVLVTFSRAGMLSLGAVILAFIISRRSYMYLVGGLLLIPLVVPFLPSVFWERLTTGISSGNSQTVTAGRLDLIWLPLWRDLPNVLLTGGGLMSVAWSKPMIRGEMLPVTHAHNAYLNTLHNLGFFGLLSVLLFYKRVIEAVRNLRSKLPDGLPSNMLSGINATLMVLAMQGLSGDMLTPTPGQTYLWISLGVLFAQLGQLDTVKQSPLT
jgi:O-antigen ligase